MVTSGVMVMVVIQNKMGMELIHLLRLSFENIVWEEPPDDQVISFSVAFELLHSTACQERQSVNQVLQTETHIKLANIHSLSKTGLHTFL